MLLWLLTGTATVIALLAFGRARSLSRRLDRLNQAYWELRYEHGVLQSRVERMAPPEPGGGEDRLPAPPPPATSFVPLSSVRR